MSSPPLAEQRTFASPVARRQRAQLVWSLAGLAPIAGAYGLGLWLEQARWVTYQFPATIAWCVPSYLLACHWLYRSAGLPTTERTSLLIVTTAMPFVLAPLGFALLQQPYSRGAVLLVFLLCMVWFALGERRHRRLHTPRLICLDASVPAKLNAMIGTNMRRRLGVELLLWQSSPTAPTPDLDGFDGVVVDTDAPDREDRRDLLRQLKLAHVRLYGVEALAEMLSGRKMLSAHDGEFWQLDSNPAYDVVKRVLDVAIVLLTLPLWLPLCLMVALAVRMDSPGPALFSQQRVGRNGRSFRLWKFRSMRHTTTPITAQFARPEDPRVTRIGRFLRRTRLDELPQLWNVLIGDMSLIGPRPEQIEFVQGFATRIHAYPYRHLVRPGLTGWAQVLQGYAASEDEAIVKLSYDLYYVAHYSLALDLLISYKTLRIILSGFGAR